MTSAVPGVVAWPLMVLMAAVVVLRYALCNARLSETYLNHILALLLCFNLLRDMSIEGYFSFHHIMAVTTTQALSLVPANFMFIEFLGFATLLSGSTPEVARRQHWYRRLVGIVLVTVTFVAMEHIRPAVFVQEALHAHGWGMLLIVLVFPIIPSAVAVQTLRLGLREWTRPNVERQEQMIAAGLITIAATILSSCPASLIWPAISEYWPLVVSGLLSALAAVPVVQTLLARAGLDKISRSWRALQPLNEALVAAVPDRIFDSPTTHGRRKTTLELHRSIVQIRDGILGLRPYFREIPQDEADRFFHRCAVLTGQREAAVQALQIAEAIRAKENGDRPTPVGVGVAIREAGPTSLEQEAIALVRVCRWWPGALATIHADPIS